MVLASFAGCGRQAAVSAPNVVVITLDTVRHDAVTNGAHRAETPFLDELRASSVEFSRARSTSSWTAPSTASLFTGLYPNEHGVIQGFLAHRETVEAMERRGDAALELNALPQQIVTLPERFRAGGYRTFGVAANINIGSEIGFSRGFERFCRLSDSPADEMVDTVAAWLPALREGDVPYFLYVHLNDAHAPYVPHEPWYRAVPDDRLEDARSRYLSEISFLDRQLARLVDLLELRSQGLLVIVSDHGEEFGEHGAEGHPATLFRELNDVVCLIHGPALGVVPAVRTELVSHVDILPTLLDMAGLPAPEPASGVSLAPLCAGNDDSGDRAAAFERRTLFAHRLRSLLRGRHVWSAMSGSWKLIENSNGHTSLFDRSSDPNELAPLQSADDPVGSGLAAALAEFRARPAVGLAAGVSVPLDQELADQLESLGYVR